jgi:small subunit ribosomal protein S12
MSTKNQSALVYKRKFHYPHSAALLKKPQARGRFNRIVILTPRKPNSALRKVGKVSLYNGKRITAKIPGSGVLPTKFSIVLARGRGHRDTPGVKYSLIRGSLECIPIFEKTRRRSLYGVPATTKLRTPRYLR